MGPWDLGLLVLDGAVRVLGRVLVPFRCGGRRGGGERWMLLGSGRRGQEADQIAAARGVVCSQNLVLDGEILVPGSVLACGRVRAGGGCLSGLVSNEKGAGLRVVRRGGPSWENEAFQASPKRRLT